MRGWIHYFWPVLIVGCISFASGRSQIATPDVGISLDKLAHFAVFGALATSFIRLPIFTSRPGAGFWVAVIVTLLFGAADEWHQASTPGRSVEVADWVADTLGGFTAAGLYRFLPWYRALLEWRVTGRDT